MVPRGGGRRRGPTNAAAGRAARGGGRGGHQATTSSNSSAALVDRGGGAVDEEKQEKVSSSSSSQQGLEPQRLGGGDRTKSVGQQERLLGSRNVRAWRAGGRSLAVSTTHAASTEITCRHEEEAREDGRGSSSLGVVLAGEQGGRRGLQGHHGGGGLNDGGRRGRGGGRGRGGRGRHHQEGLSWEEEAQQGQHPQVRKYS